MAKNSVLSVNKQTYTIYELAAAESLVNLTTPAGLGAFITFILLLLAHFTQLTLAHSFATSAIGLLRSE